MELRRARSRRLGALFRAKSYDYLRNQSHCRGKIEDLTPPNPPSMIFIADLHESQDPTF
jgi:hypothetical protein